MSKLATPLLYRNIQVIIGDYDTHPGQSEPPAILDSSLTGFKKHLKHTTSLVITTTYRYRLTDVGCQHFIGEVFFAPTRVEELGIRLTAVLPYLGEHMLRSFR